MASNYFYKKKGTRQKIKTTKSLWEMMKKSQVKDNFHFYEENAVDAKAPDLSDDNKPSQTKKGLTSRYHLKVLCVIWCPRQDSNLRHQD